MPFCVRAILGLSDLNLKFFSPALYSRCVSHAKTEEVQQALVLVENGSAVRAAARESDIAEITLRRALAKLGRNASDALQRDGMSHEDVTAGLQVHREAALAKTVERYMRDVGDIPPGQLRDLAVALGILDDKVAGRGMGNSVNVTQATQIIVKSEWPEP